VRRLLTPALRRRVGVRRHSHRRSNEGRAQLWRGRLDIAHEVGGAADPGSASPLTMSSEAKACRSEWSESCPWPWRPPP
jgi:hypothetical protein